jgi:DnaD/phage-associated family protein
MKQMKIDLLFGSSVINLPAAALDRLATADEAELKVLIALGDANIRAALDVEALAERLAITPEAVEGAIQFWRGAGVLKKSTSKAGAADTAPAKPAPVQAAPATPVQAAPTPVPVPVKAEPPRASVTIVRSDDGTPHYTAEEIQRIFEENGELSGMINECQNIFGKIFNPTEVNKLMALSEYFRLDCEYILLLCYHCQKIGKASVPYLDKLARSLYNEGVDTVDSLGERLEQLESAADLGNYYRTLCGAGGRTFTERESKFLNQWIKWGITPELLKLAYEAAVDGTNAPSMPYTNKVLSNWKEAGYTTAEQVKAAMEDYKQKKDNRASASQGSFATDEFFEAALRRSLALHEGNG